MKDVMTNDGSLWGLLWGDLFSGFEWCLSVVDGQWGLGYSFSTTIDPIMANRLLSKSSRQQQAVGGQVWRMLVSGNNNNKRKKKAFVGIFAASVAFVGTTCGFAHRTFVVSSLSPPTRSLYHHHQATTTTAFISSSSTTDLSNNNKQKRASFNNKRQRQLIRKQKSRLNAHNNKNDNQKKKNMQDDSQPTTNAHDQAEVARLKARLTKQQQQTSSSLSFTPVPQVSIDEGAHKYVLISARSPSQQQEEEEQHFVTSKRGASYHRNAAEPYVDLLQDCGYTDIQVTGGGRIFLDEDKQFISIYGFSYGFGLANHEISKQIVEADPRYKDYTIQISNEGY